MSGFQTRSASAASQGGPWSNNPAHLPLVLSSAANKIWVKNSVTTTYPDDTNGGIAGWMGLSVVKSGAVIEIASADTWTTVCDLTGAGFLTAVISPTYSISASFAPFIRITVDGEEYVFTSATAPAAYSRLVLGGVPNCVPVSATTGGGAGVGEYSDIGFGAVATHNGLLVSEGTYIPSAQLQVSSGGQACRFEKSLKVEVKCSKLGSTSATKAAYAVYQLDKNS